MLVCPMPISYPSALHRTALAPMARVCACAHADSNSLNTMSQSHQCYSVGLDRSAKVPWLPSRTVTLAYSFGTIASEYCTQSVSLIPGPLSDILAVLCVTADRRQLMSHH